MSDLDLAPIIDTADFIEKTACLIHEQAHPPKDSNVFENTRTVSYAHEITCKLLGYFAGDILIVEQPISYDCGSYTTDKLGDKFIVAYVAIAYHNIEEYFGLDDGDLRHEHFVAIKEELKKIIHQAYGI